MIDYFMFSFKEKLTKKIHIYACTYIIIGVAEALVHLTTMLIGIGIIYPVEVNIKVIIALSCYNFLAFLMLSAFTRFNLRQHRPHICLQIFRHITQKFLDIRQYACEIFMQSDKKSDCASARQ